MLLPRDDPGQDPSPPAHCPQCRWGVASIVGPLAAAPLPRRHKPRREAAGYRARDIVAPAPPSRTASGPRLTIWEQSSRRSTPPESRPPLLTATQSTYPPPA